MKKLMSLFLIVTLLGSVLVGCGATEAGESISESSTVNADGGNQEEQFEFASSDTFDIDNQSEIGHLTLAGYRVFAEKDGYIDFDIIVLNNTNKVINTVSVNVNILDANGNIIDSTYPQMQVLRVQPGQMISVDGNVEKGSGKTIMADEYSFYYDEEEYYSGYFDEVEAVSLESPTVEYFVDQNRLEHSAVVEDVIMPEGDEDILVSDLTVDDISDEYADISVMMKNNTDSAITNLSVFMELLDENGNIIGMSISQEPSRIQPQQSIKLSGSIDINRFDSAYFTVDSYSYYISDEDYVQGYIQELPKAVKINNNSAKETTKEQAGENVSESSPDKINSYTSESIIEGDAYVVTDNIYKIMQENFHAILGHKIKNIEMVEGYEAMKIESEDVDYIIICHENPSTDDIFFGVQYDVTEPKIVIEDMALFVQCFCPNKTYGEVVKLLKEQSHNWPEGTYRINSHFSIEGVLFHIMTGKSTDGKKDGFSLEVHADDINYVTKDAKETLRLMGVSEDNNFEKVNNLTDHQAQEMVQYYRDHEMEYISSVAELAERCNIDFTAHSSETSQRSTTDYSDSQPGTLHKCEQCGKSATHSIQGLNGYDEWYCDEHWQQMQDALDYMLNN